MRRRTYSYYRRRRTYSYYREGEPTTITGEGEPIITGLGDEEHVIVLEEGDIATIGEGEGEARHASTACGSGRCIPSETKFYSQQSKDLLRSFCHSHGYRARKAAWIECDMVFAGPLGVIE